MGGPGGLVHLLTMQSGNVGVLQILEGPEIRT